MKVMTNKYNYIHTYTYFVQLEYSHKCCLSVFIGWWIEIMESVFRKILNTVNFFVVKWNMQFHITSELIFNFGSFSCTTTFAVACSVIIIMYHLILASSESFGSAFYIEWHTSLGFFLRPLLLMHAFIYLPLRHLLRQSISFIRCHKNVIAIVSL